MSRIEQPAFEELDYIDEDIEQEILALGVMTGSARFYSVAEASDIDYIISPHNVELLGDIKDFYTMNKVIYSDSGDTHPIYVRFRTYAKPVNLIFTNDEKTFLAWSNTTAIICNLIKSSYTMYEKLRNRTNRVALFKTIREILLSQEVYGTATQR